MINSKICSLDKLKIGEEGKVVSINETNCVYRRRCLDMGITEGVVVKIGKKAPLGDPITLLLRGYELCVRKSTLKNIMVEVLL